MVLTAMAFPAQAQTTNICDRTPQVVDEILRQTSADTCGSVSVSEMANTANLELTAGIPSLQPKDFNGFSRMKNLYINTGDLTELPNKVFLGLPALQLLYIAHTSLKTLPSDVFSNLSSLQFLTLIFNQLNTLPSGIFSGLTNLTQLRLGGNPGTPFELQVHLQVIAFGDPESFTVGAIRLVMPVGAPRPVTIPVTIAGGTPTTASLVIPTGSVESADFKITLNEGNFQIRTGEITLGGNNDDFTGFNIVEGSRLSTIVATRLRVKVFLEGALE